MRKEAHPPKLCDICKLPITDEQRPAVQLKNGDEVHVECYRKYEEAARRPNYLRNLAHHWTPPRCKRNVSTIARSPFSAGRDSKYESNNECLRLLQAPHHPGAAPQCPTWRRPPSPSRMLGSKRRLGVPKAVAFVHRSSRTPRRQLSVLTDPVKAGEERRSGKGLTVASQVGGESPAAMLATVII